MPSWPMEMPSDTAMVMNSKGKPARVPDPLLGPLGQPVEGKVARGDLVPRRRHPDLGLVPVVVGHPHRPQHGPGRRPGGAVGHLVAAGLRPDQWLLRRVGARHIAHLCMVRRAGVDACRRPGPGSVPSRHAVSGGGRLPVTSAPMRTAPHRPRMLPRTIALVGSALAALPIGLSACGGSSSAPTTTSTTVPRHRHPCRRVTPAQIQSVVGVAVASPSASGHGTTTLCTYKAANLADSVIVGYDSAATTTSFQTDRAGLRRRGDKVGKILGLGDEAFYAVATTGGRDGDHRGGPQGIGAGPGHRDRRHDRAGDVGRAGPGQSRILNERPPPAVVRYRSAYNSVR